MKNILLSILILVPLIGFTQDDTVIHIKPLNDGNQVNVDMNAEKVLRESLEALGGIEKIKKIDKLYQKQEMEMDMGVASISIKTELHYLDSSTLLNKVSSTMNGTTNSAQSLIKDGKVYSRLTDSDNWTLTQGQSMAMVSNSTNYINEYQLLEKAYKVTYSGTDTVDGKTYYILETPEEVITENTEVKTTEKKKYYYSVETGLLTYVDWDTNMGAIVSKSWVHYLDYRSVSGILYSFRQEMTSNMVVNGTDMNVKTITTYPVIEINPDFDESMFKLH